MKKIIILFIFITISGCKENTVDSIVTPGDNIIYRKDGRVDSLIFSGPVEESYIDLNFTGYSKARVTLKYKANVDSAYYFIFKGASSFWGFPKYNHRTNGLYIDYDSTFNISSLPNGSYKKILTLYCDTCYFISKDLKIYGIQ